MNDATDLPIAIELAEWDWVQVGSHGEKLHAPERLADPERWDLQGYMNGVTACGLKGKVFIPGLFDRMGAARCIRCCDKVGIPNGVGSPKNDEALRPFVKARISTLIGDREPPGTP